MMWQQWRGTPRHCLKWQRKYNYTQGVISAGLQPTRHMAALTACRKAQNPEFKILWLNIAAKLRPQGAP